MEAMTERKPRGMSFTSWIDQQVSDAEKRGVFDNLPGAGKPLNLKPHDDEDYGQAWVRDYARREGVRPEEFLPTPLRLRREAEMLAEAVAEMRTEEEVRAAVADINRRIVEWRKIPDGPPVFVRLVSKDDMVARWRAARQARPAPPPPQEPGPQAGPRKPGPRRGWRVLWNRERRGGGPASR
jgi:hypothetical protein